MYRGLCINYNRFPYFTKLPELPRKKGIRKIEQRGRKKGCFLYGAVLEWILAWRRRLLTTEKRRPQPSITHL